MNSETDGQAHGVVATGSASAQMRAAREAAGLQLTEVAARTRVPLRHLEALERGDFAALPGITYCAGFTRAYARAVGLDEKALVAQVREEIDAAGDFAAVDAYQIDEPTDPARVPPRRLAWVAGIAGLLMVSGYGLWRMQINTPPGEDVVADAPVAPSSPALPRTVQAPVLNAPVVLTAVEDVWLRIYDADGKSLLQKTLVKGESYTVPVDANHPMILTGRPDALAVTVGGRAIPPLGTAERTISDVPIDGDALLGRGTASSAPTAAVGAAGAIGPATTQAPASASAARPVSSQSGQSQPARSQPARSTPAAGARPSSTGAATRSPTTPPTRPATPVTQPREPQPAASGAAAPVPATPASSPAAGD
ncbi:MAG: RodZ domain-containing protein [Sphingobium sp.]